jgi:D-galacturonate reductase
MYRPSITIVGGGMITHDQILPSVYQLQRLGRVGEIGIVALRRSFLNALENSDTMRRAFPGQGFRPYPETETEQPQPDLYKQVIAGLPPRQIVVVAAPDQLHYEMILTALRAGQHVCTVKPLVLKHDQAVEIEREAYARGLVVGIEYHKRFDDRSMMARRKYREGWFGEFRLGTARLFEKWYYRHSNFQNWMTVENSDSFTYIGCHYVDLVHFITGLLPTAVSLYGIPDKYPNGNMGFLWTDARVLWNNGACLNVQNGLSFPDAAPGPNTQGMTLYCQTADTGGLIDHSDQYRGLKYSYVRQPEDPGSTQFSEPSPDYLQYLDLGGGGLVPTGYGYRSIEHIIGNCIRVESETEGLRDPAALAKRQELIRDIDARGVMATPANSAYNELVIEAGRMSVLNGGREVAIEYGEHPQVRPK